MNKKLGLQLRIIGGVNKGRIIQCKSYGDLEPTKSIVKEALFNVIADSINDAVFLDLFSGTGNIGLEALSRGAKMVYFVEKRLQYIESIRFNLMQLGSSPMDGTSIINNDVYKFLKLDSEIDADYIFCDPPYMDFIHQQHLLFALSCSSCVKEHTQIIVEHRYRLAHLDYLCLVKERCYGKTQLSFFVKK